MRVDSPKCFEEPTTENVFAEMKRLLALVYQSPDGEHRLHDGSPLYICNRSALLMKLKFGGDIFGYFAETNPTADIGRSEGGHDFLVVGDVIIDMWAAIIYLTPPVVRIGTEEAKRLYGDQNLWERVTEGEE